MSTTATISGEYAHLLLYLADCTGLAPCMPTSHWNLCESPLLLFNTSAVPIFQMFNVVLLIAHKGPTVPGIEVQGTYCFCRDYHYSLAASHF